MLVFWSLWALECHRRNLPVSSPCWLQRQVWHISTSHQRAPPSLQVEWWRQGAVGGLVLPLLPRTMGDGREMVRRSKISITRKDTGHSCFYWEHSKSQGPEKLEKWIKYFFGNSHCLSPPWWAALGTCPVPHSLDLVISESTGSCPTYVPPSYVHSTRAETFACFAYCYVQALWPVSDM